MTADSEHPENPADGDEVQNTVETESCVKGVSRKEFVRTLMRKGLMAGALYTAVSAATRFKVPAAYAAATF